MIPPHQPKDYLYVFLARIIRNISLNCCRSRDALKRKAFICELSDELAQCIPAPDNVECCIDDIAFSEMVNGFLEMLSREKRNVFVRRYWYFDSISDIAKRYNKSESSVKTMLFRCRNEFREYIIKEGYTI